LKSNSRKIIAQHHESFAQCTVLCEEVGKIIPWLLDVPLSNKNVSGLRNKFGENNYNFLLPVEENPSFNKN
jgi:hypothetical protein